MQCLRVKIRTRSPNNPNHPIRLAFSCSDQFRSDQIRSVQFNSVHCVHHVLQLVRHVRRAATSDQKGEHLRVRRSAARRSGTEAAKRVAAAGVAHQVCAVPRCTLLLPDW